MRGNGSITKAGRDTWRICVDTGKDPITGKRRRKTRRIHGKKADAQRELRDLITQIENGLDVNGASTTFKEYAQRWHESRIANGEHAERTMHSESQLLKFIYPIMGHVRLEDITPSVIDSALAAIRREKEQRLGREICPTTMRKYHVLLKQIMKSAMNHDLIARNPCDRVKAPKVAPVNRRSLTANELSRLVRFIDSEEQRIFTEYREKEQRAVDRGALFGRACLRQLHDLGNVIAVRIAVATGARLSEVLALQWENVDTDGGSIKISHAIDLNGGLKETKSGEPRIIAVDSVCSGVLAAWKERQRVELAKLSITQDGATPVCCNDIGGFFRSDNFQGWWRAFRERAGFPALKFHELRHTHATLLLANGVDVKTVQTRMGHKSASITLNLYAHAIPGNDRKAAALIGDLYSGEDVATPRIVQMKSA